jgi:hypothetical protein
VPGEVRHTLPLLLPLAHTGHYALWALYVLPVLVVIGATIRSAVAQRQDEEGDEPGSS